MKRAALAVTLLLAATPLAAQQKLPDLPRLMTPRSVSSLPAAAPDETIAYGEAPSQKVEYFRPRANAGTPDAPHPVVVLLHGGCWLQALAGPEQVRAAAGAFVDKGYAVWSVGYRRIDEEGGGYPGTYQDVGKAIDLLVEQAATRKLDMGRVVFFGHSAGGHLALWAAGRGKIPAGSPLATEKPLKPRGVVAVGGIGSLKNWEREINQLCGPETVAKLAPGEGDTRFQDTSPDMLLPTGTRIVMLHGVFDPAAYPAVGLDFAQQARKAGDLAEIQIAPVSGHFEVIAPGTPAFSQALAAVERLSNSY